MPRSILTPGRPVRVAVFEARARVAVLVLGPLLIGVVLAVIVWRT